MMSLCCSRSRFSCPASRSDTTCFTIRNTGSTILFWHFEERHPQALYRESVVPQDPTRRFCCHLTDGKILPGAQQIVHVTFLSEMAGCFSAEWQLVTNPVIETPVYTMHGVAHFQHPDILQDFLKEIRADQVEAWSREVVADVFNAVQVVPFEEEPDLRHEPTRTLVFEEANGGQVGGS